MIKNLFVPFNHRLLLPLFTLPIILQILFSDSFAQTSRRRTASWTEHDFPPQAKLVWVPVNVTAKRKKEKFSTLSIDTKLASQENFKDQLTRLLESKLGNNNYNDHDDDNNDDRGNYAYDDHCVNASYKTPPASPAEKSSNEFLPSYAYIKSLKKFGIPKISTNGESDFPLNQADLKYLYHNGYLTIYNTMAHSSMMGIHMVEAPLGKLEQHSASKHRKKFSTDSLLPMSDRVEPKEYSDTTYSKGHLVPFADFDQEKFKQETNLTSNVAPQVQLNFNDSLWSDLENCIRTWKSLGRSLTVYTGVIFKRPELSSVINHTVMIPQYFYKIIVDDQDNIPEVVSFIMENRSYAPKEKNLALYTTSIEEIQKKSGFDFLMILTPDERERLIKMNFSHWPGCEHIGKQGTPVIRYNTLEKNKEDEIPELLL